MKGLRWSGGILGLAAVLFVTTGCLEQEKKGATEKKPDEVVKNKHSGWWCTEHGIPEHECSMCLPDDEVQRRFKAKGDWCDKHERAKSQCFKCDPMLKETFAAKYRQKYGKEPPPITEEEEEKEKEKKDKGDDKK